MPILSDYSEFEGRHWETGTVRNALAYQAMHSSEAQTALSEATLLGISGGAAFGYFVFDYEATDPFLALLSRNTFDPLDILLERLAIPHELFHTPNADKAERNLMEVLESGRPAIVWADVFSLPYNALGQDDAMWAMNPILVYGYDNGRAHVADRAKVPLEIGAEQLSLARARIKKDRNRVLALGAPNTERLPRAMEDGIRQCIALYSEAPPKGARHNFGFAAYERWIELLTDSRDRQSWARLLPPGRRLYAALAGFGFQPGGFGWARTFPSNQVDDKSMYADFLQQAANLLGRPQLVAAAESFRAASSAWRELSDRMLPEEVPPFRETRELLLTRRQLFGEHGLTALPEIQGINSRLAEILGEVARDFPLSDERAAELRQHIAEQVQLVADIEREAVAQMQTAMA